MSKVTSTQSYVVFWIRDHRSAFNVLIFQPLYFALKRLHDTEKVLSRKSDGVSTKTIVTPTTVNNSISPTIK